MQTTRISIETMHTYNPHEGEPRDYNNPQVLYSRVQQELLLQLKFEIIKQGTFRV
jgi:hypothetical protein